ncbi:MAG TPA: glycosyltransferase family 39 protein [Hymenobacter sp.]|jgi:4-amino-4-deoxy-L-arabinose transferase|uniref:ArnT family glycosyltransferase n=1 Tax=Hymenobacter sp. TaxID=1898978 RepID=UPI002ED89A68
MPQVTQTAQAPTLSPVAPQPARYWLWLLLLALAVGLGANLNGWGVLESSEARYAEIGREMLASRDWLHPRLLGIQHFHKPPLTYWLTAAGLVLAGPTALGARLLPVLAVLAQVALVYGLGRQLFAGDRARALAAAVVYSTLPVVLISALNLTTDAYLLTLELAAAYAVLRYAAGGRARWLYAAALALGLASLTKGPVGVVLPLMVTVGLNFRQPRVRRPLTGHHVLSAGLFLVVGLSWYVYLAFENPAFVRYFLLEHTVERFVNPETFGRSKPWWFYLVLAPAASLPWSAALLARAWRSPWAEVPRQWRNVLLFWIAAPLVFFSLSSSKLLLYVLPIFPGVALAVVYYLGRSAEGVLRRWYLGLAWFFGGLLLVFGAAWAVGAAWKLPVVLSPWVGVWAAVGVGGLLGQHRLWRPGGVAARLLLVPVVGTVCVLLAAKAVLRENELLFNGTRPVAARLLSPDFAHRQVVVYNRLLPSLAFELKQIPVSLFDGNLTLRRETQFEPDQAWRRQLIDLQDPKAPRIPLVQRWARSPVLVVKGKLIPEREWLRAGLTREEVIGPWRLYY